MSKAHTRARRKKKEGSSVDDGLPVPKGHPSTIVRSQDIVFIFHSQSSSVLFLLMLCDAALSNILCNHAINPHFMMQHYSSNM